MNTIVVLFLGSILLLLAHQFNIIVPVYMDEPFHVNQTSAYCRGDWFSWDPKITTFPGLYIVMVLYSYILHPFTENSCSLTTMRSLNLIFAFGNLFILYKISKTLFPGKTEKEVVLKTLSGFFFPPVFFFYFLFYTDAGSLFFILAAYYASMKNSFYISSVLGGISILFRQTNVIWVGFILGVNVLRSEYLSPKMLHESTFASRFFLIGSVVVGDKQAHAMSFHIPQLFYFILFTGICLSSHLIHFLLFKFKYQIYNKITIFIILFLTIIFFFFVYKFTVVHSYILSDNRHFTFYLWKRVISNFQYHLVPFYSFFFYLIWKFCESNFNFFIGDEKNGYGYCLLVVFMYFVCCFVTLVPAQLIEFRYFIIPFYFLHIHFISDQKLTIFEIICYAFINLITIYVFLYKPFVWVDGTIARFMW